MAVLTEEASGLLQSLARNHENIPSLVDDIMARIEEMYSNAGLTDTDVVDVTNFGSGMRPSLYLISESGTELGTIDVGRDGELHVKDYNKEERLNVIPVSQDGKAENVMDNRNPELEMFIANTEIDGFVFEDKDGKFLGFPAGPEYAQTLRDYVKQNNLYQPSSEQYYDALGKKIREDFAAGKLEEVKNPDMNAVATNEVFCHTAKFTEEHENVSKDEAVKETAQIFKKNDLNAPSLEGILQHGFEQINSVYKDMGVKQSKEIKDIQQNILDGVKVNKADKLREELAQIKDTINKLYGEIEQEINIAVTNGYGKESAEKISEKMGEIAKETANACDLKLQIDREENGLMNKIKKTVPPAVKNYFAKAKAALDVGIKAGVGSLTSGRNTIREANEKFKVQGKSAYVGMEEKINVIDRNFQQIIYGMNKTVSNNLDKARAGIEHYSEKVANIKGAFKDLGRALRGKERTGQSAEYTKFQSWAINSLSSISQDCRKNMSDIEEKFDKSQEKSIANINDIQQKRTEMKMDFSMSLAARVKNIEASKISQTKEKVFVGKAKDEVAL